MPITTKLQRAEFVMRNDDNLTPEIAAAGGLYKFVTAPPLEKLRGHHQLRALTFLLLLIVSLNFYAPGSLTLEERILGSAMIASLAVPVWLWKIGFDRSIPFLAMVQLVYIYYFALPVFLLNRFAFAAFMPSIAPQLIERALEYSLIGIACMLLGYYGPLIIFARPIIPRLNLPWHDPRAIRTAGIVFGFVGLFFVLAGPQIFPESLAELGGLGADVCTIGICALLLLQLLGRLNLAATLMLWGFFIPVRLGLGFVAGGSGGANGPFAIALTLAVAYASVRRRIPWLLIVVGTLFLLLFRALEIPYRAAAWRGPLSDASPVEKLEYIGDLLNRTVIGGEVSFETMMQISASRMAQFTILADVIRDTPQSVPYWGGATYYPLLFKLIPRFLLPNKPEEVSGQSFGHRYGFTPASDIDTSINLAQLVELYANFGLLGLIVGMTFFGLFYRLLMELFVHPEMGFGALIGSILMVGQSVEIGAAASMSLGAILWIILLIIAVSVIVKVNRTGRGAVEMLPEHA